MEDARVTLTLKGGRDFDAPWLVIKGDSWDEVAATAAAIPGFTDLHLSGIPEAILGLQPVGIEGAKAALGATDVNVSVQAAAPPEPQQATQTAVDTPYRIKDPTAPASEAQVGLIRKLRGTIPPGGLTKEAASAYINELKARKG